MKVNVNNLQDVLHLNTIQMNYAKVFHQIVLVMERNA